MGATRNQIKGGGSYKRKKNAASVIREKGNPKDCTSKKKSFFAICFI